MRARLAAIALILTTALAAVSARDNTDAQTSTVTPSTTELVATISVYQTQVAGLESKVDKQATSIAKRDRKIDAQRTQIAELQDQLPTASATVPTVNSNGAVVFGEYGDSGMFRMKVVDAFTLPSGSSGVEELIIVTFEVTNIIDDPVAFGRPDSAFEVESSDGRSYEDDLFLTADATVTNGEWSGELAPGKTYQQSVGFVIPKADPNVYPDAPSGWTVIYHENTLESTGDFRFALNF